MHLKRQNGPRHGPQNRPKTGPKKEPKLELHQVNRNGHGKCKYCELQVQVQVHIKAKLGKGIQPMIGRCGNTVWASNRTPLIYLSPPRPAITTPRREDLRWRFSGSRSSLPRSLIWVQGKRRKYVTNALNLFALPTS